MLPGLGDGLDPAVIGCFHVTDNLVSRHFDHIQLVLKGVDGEQIVENEHAGLYASVVGKRCGDGQFGGLLVYAQPVDEVDVVAHPDVGVPGAKFGVQDTYFLHGEGLDGLIFLAEMVAHHGIGLCSVYGNEVGQEGFGYHLTVLHAQAHLSVRHKTAVAAGIEEGGIGSRLHIGFVVVAADDPVHAFYRIEYVHGFGFGVGAVSSACGRVDDRYHHIGLFTLPHIVHILLDASGDGFKVHAAPHFLGQPGLDVRILVAQDGNTQARLHHHFVHGEVGFAVVVAHGVGGQEGHACLHQLPLNAVIHGVSRLHIVVTPCDGVIFHVSHQAGEQVGRHRIYIIIVIGGIVSLQAVSGIYQ